MLRKKPGEEKSKCGLTFKLNLEIPLSIAAIDSLSDSFIQAVNNNNDDRSQILREFLLKRLNINNKKELDLLFEKIIKEGRDLIYKNLNTSRTNSFSHILTEDINKYIKKHTNEI